MSLSVEEVNNLEDLQRRRLAWQALEASTSDQAYWQTYEAVASAWAEAGPTDRLRVFLVQFESRLIGALPLIEQRIPTPLGGVTRLGSLRLPEAPRFGPIGPYETATLAATLRQLASTPRSWDVLELERIDDNGRTECAMRLAGFPTTTCVDTVRPMIDLDETTEPWRDRASTSAKPVRERLARQGNVEFVRYRPQPGTAGDGEVEWRLFEQLLTLDSTANGPLDRCSATHSSAAWLGMLDLAILYLDGEPLAGCYGRHNRGLVDLVWGGGDASTQTALVDWLIEDSKERGDHQIRFPSNSQAAWRLRTGVETTTRLTAFAASVWRPRWLRRARWYATRARRAA